MPPHSPTMCSELCSRVQRDGSCTFFLCSLCQASCSTISSTDAPVKKHGPFEGGLISERRRLQLRIAVAGHSAACIDVDERTQLFLRSGDGGRSCPFSKADFTRYRYHIITRAVNCSVLGVRRAN